MNNTPVVPDPVVPASYLRTLLANVERAGHRAEDLLASEGLSQAVLRSTEHVPADVFGRLYQRGMWLLDDESLGMVSVNPVPAGTFRLMCQCMILCPTLGALMERAEEFFDIVDVSGVKPSATLSGDNLCLGFASPKRRRADELPAVLKAAEPVQIRTSLYYWYNLLAWFVGRAPDLHHVEFAFPESPQGYEWRGLFGAPVQFDAPSSALVMPRRVLSLPNVQNEQTLSEFLRETPYRLVVPSYMPPSLQDRLRALFTQMPGEAPPTSEEVASRVGMSVSTLRRKLAAEGISWQELKEEGRRAAALRYVADTELPIAEVTRLLGFDEASTFFRAFRRWTGTTPSRYRAELKSDTEDAIDES